MSERLPGHGSEAVAESSPRPDYAKLLEDFVAAGLLVPLGAPGLYGRGADFEEVRLQFEWYVRRLARPDGAEELRFPPVVPRRLLEEIGYLESFPHLAGTIFAFEGDEVDAVEQGELASRHDDWSRFQRMTDLALAPAACYPVYPVVAARGPLPDGGVTIDAGGAYVFRREPSDNPARLQMFHQREIVRLGEPSAVLGWRDTWLDRATAALSRLRLEPKIAIGADAFFGRGGQIMARNQRAQALKFELVVEIAEPTAVASFNYHQDHFGSVFGIRTSSGDTAHTACLGFGEERITMALFCRHGLELAAWPADLRAELWA